MRILVTDGMDKTAMAQLRDMGHEVVEPLISSKELKLQDVVIMTDSIPFCFLILPVFII